LMTTLCPGELRIKKGSDEISLAISGGFLEVRPERVIVLADAAERADEIDVTRAEAAKQRAKERLAHRAAGVEEAGEKAALERALTRIRIAEKVKRRKRQIQ
jgi:F-type H+-transporting ATPase subunit epsilon